jgi:hypothetical protein
LHIPLENKQEPLIMFARLFSLALLLGCFTCLPISSTPAQDAAPDFEPIAQVPRLGNCTHMRWRERGWEVEKLIPILKQMGVSTIRDGLSWGRTEKVKGQYALDLEDEAWITAALQADIKIIFMLGYGNKVYANPLDADGYANFAAWLAQHFKGNRNILAFELWNEPSNFHFAKQYGGAWNAKGDAPWLAEFAKLVEKSAAAIKQVDPDRTVITGAGTPPGSMHMIERYPQAFAHVDGLTLHPYSFRLPPEVVPYGGAGIAQRDGISAAGEDHAMRSLWQTLENQMQQHLGRKLGIWVTEVGYTTFNHTLKAGLYAGYTEPVQAAYLVRSTVAGLAWSNIKTYCLYDLMNDGRNPAVNEDNFGLVRHKSEGLAPKNSFFALRRMSELLGGYYQFLSDPPVELQSKSAQLDENDVWKKRPVDSYVTDHSPQAYWFKTDKGYVTFIWRHGRINGEHNPPLANLPVLEVPSDTTIQITDLVTGLSLNHLVQRAGNDVAINHLPLNGYPIAIAWNTAGQLKTISEPVAGGAFDLPLTDARGHWKFTNGPEFKGAIGSMDVPEKNGKPLVIHYDFTGGGNYVSAFKLLDPKLSIEKLSIHADTASTDLSLRVIDQTGQTFQYKLNTPDAGGPVTLDLSKAKPMTSWGGAKDRKLHYPLGSLWIMVTRKSASPSGSVSINSIQTTILSDAQ